MRKNVPGNPRAASCRAAVPRWEGTASSYVSETAALAPPGHANLAVRWCVMPGICAQAAGAVKSGAARPGDVAITRPAPSKFGGTLPDEPSDAGLRPRFRFGVTPTGLERGALICHTYILAMRPATLALNLGFLLTSFTLGVISGRQETAAHPAPERLPVAGSATDSAAEASPKEAGAEAREEPPRERKQAAKTAAPPPVPEPPSWSQLASRAQKWTAAVRADHSYGAGVVLDGAGLVLTNLHVVEGAKAISVTPFGAEVTPAELLDSDGELDLALLRLPVATPNSASLGTARSLGVGDEVLAVGSPRKMYFSVSRGMVSFPNRFLDGVEYIQTDLPINVGNSGGPLVDREGRVIGVVSFILRDSQGISFALPIDRALTRFAKHLEGAAPQMQAAASPPPATASQ